MLAGLAAGGLPGFLSRPQAAEIRLSPLNVVEVQDTGSAAGAGGGELTLAQLQHIGLYALIGAVVGFGAKFVADSSRR